MQSISRERYESGLRYEEFRRTAEKHQGLWDGVYDHLETPAAVVKRLEELPGRRHVLVLAEDWCGDAASLVPVIARLADAVPDSVDMRILERDENLDIMDRYLTHGGRSIPVAIVFDDDMEQLGWWGPRPAPAQALFRENIRAFRAGDLEDKGQDVYRPLLRWYREDGGRHTMEELLTILERGGELRT